MNPGQAASEKSVFSDTGYSLLLVSGIEFHNIRGEVYQVSLRKVVKQNPAVKKHLYGIRKYLYYMALTPLKAAKVDQKKILFNNFQGMSYAGNPRAIADKMHEMDPSVKLLWLCAEKGIENTLPAYVSPVRMDTPRYFYEIATSGTWVFNIMPARGLLKKKEQLYIQTYHGDRAIKKVHYQNIGKKETDHKYAIHDDICDYGVVGSESGAVMFRDGIGFHGPLIREGTPRDDCLVHPDPKRYKKIKRRLKVAENEKLLLYAPTFRAGNDALKTKIDFERLLDLLQKKTGDTWRCLYRAHFHTSSIQMQNSDTSRYIDVSKYPDMADLLMVSDMLITDYSSSSGDFCITGKPVIMFIDEEENYPRSLVIDMDASPFMVVHTQEQLEQLIVSLDEAAVEENKRALIEFFGIHETGHAAEACCKVILEHIKRNSKKV
jgi:CDP-glycerol glycerophosphotransferase